MKLRINTIVFCCTLLILTACVSDKKVDAKYKNIVNEHLNIIITPDLSNRVKSNMYTKPVSDIDLIKSVFDNYYPTLYEYNYRISGQKDALHLDFTNANIISEYNYDGVFSFDIYEKEEQNELYLKTFDGSQTQFQKDTNEFINKLENVYNQVAIKPAGADISSYFKNRLKTIVKKDKLNDTVQNYIVDTKYRNILVLFTDGYLEAGLYGKSNCIENKCYYLDGTLVNNFRKDYKKNGQGKDLKTFFYEQEYGIIPVKNENLKDIEILICEVFDRSLNPRTGSKTVVPTDYEIIKIFWEDWVGKSGFKKYEIIPKVNSVDEFQTELMSFINS
ncbi:hypothetical protein [Oceanihabitans sediminis]|uniref:hypothetical protein n=1 Tax=Oceanihabitans sediminis TaxID=1812012 RepID=UPI003A9473EB